MEREFSLKCNEVDRGTSADSWDGWDILDTETGELCGHLDRYDYALAADPDGLMRERLAAARRLLRVRRFARLLEATAGGDPDPGG